MKFRFSPIESSEKLFEAIEYIHITANQLCNRAFSRYLPNAGNIGIFCHFDYEYDYLQQLKVTLTLPSDNPNQKYFTLREPIYIQPSHDIPVIAYKYLYIRKPRVESPEVGDIDFYLDDVTFQKYKDLLLSGKEIPNARIFERKDLNMIELYNPDIDVIAYVSTLSETERVRIKQSEATQL